MKEKLAKLLFKIIRIGILVIILLNLMNIIILKVSISDEFKNAKWKGEWESGNFSLISGKIIANFPDEIPNNKVFEVDAMIYYNIWSIYKMGRIKKIKLLGTLGNDNLESGVNVFKENNTLNSNLLFNFKSKFSEGENQEINYLGISNKDRTMIVGGYKSSMPNDLGNFKIEKGL